MAKQPLTLASGDYVLGIEPQEGGAVAQFDWRGQNIFRPRCGPGPLNSACFPLVPFSNRIAFGRFEAGGRVVQLAPNFPGADHPHPLHGWGWLQPWKAEPAAPAEARLSLSYAGEEWPWPFQARQRFVLSPSGMRHEISVRNRGETPMPAGLGAHPYFPASPKARYSGRHLGEWKTGEDGLPIALHLEQEPRDWWDGAPIASRSVDTVYVGRSGALEIAWPERAMALSIEPCSALSFTTVFTPKDADYFCVEPVSHETDAVNRTSAGASGLRWLAPGEEFSVHIDYTARAT